jgi:O-antigen/teichoic acid export membrane protein
VTGREPRSLGDRTVAGGAWKLFTVASQVVLQVIVLAVLARFIRPEEFGIVALAKIVIAFATMFSSAGLGPALIQRSRITVTHLRVGFTSGVLLAVGLWVLIWLSAPALAAFFREDEVTWVLRIIGGSFVLLSFGLVSKALLERSLDFRRLMMADLGSYLGYGIVGIFGAIQGYGVWALVAATLAQRLIFSVTCFRLRPHSVAPSLARRELGELLSFGGGLTVSRVFHFLGNYGDKALAGRLLGAGPLGFYERAYHLMNLPQQYLGNVIDSVMFPALARVQDQRGRLTKAFLRALSLTNLLLLPFSVAVVVLAPEIVAVVLGPMWEAAVVPLQVLSSVTWLKGAVRICDSLARAVGAVYRSASRKACYATAVLTGTYVGSASGVDGVAVGVSLAVLLITVLMLQLGISILHAPWRALVPVAGPGLLFGFISAVVLVPTTILLRGLQAPAVVTLASAGGGAMAACLLILIGFPRWMGVGGLWVMRRALLSVPHRGRVVEYLRRSVVDP